jgi:hypothetical protein
MHKISIGLKVKRNEGGLLLANLSYVNSHIAMPIEGLTCHERK